MPLGWYTENPPYPAKQDITMFALQLYLQDKKYLEIPRERDLL